MKARPIFFLLLAGFFGFGFGQVAWAISIQNPDFLWPHWSHLSFLAFGFFLGFAWAELQAWVWRFFFHWAPLWGLRIGALSVSSGLLGWLWPLLLRLPMPPPHDFPLRKLEMLLAAMGLICLSLALLLVLLGLSLSRGFREWPARSLALRLGALAFLVYFLTGLWTAAWHMTGDAPHYLLLTHSLATRQSVDLKPDYQSGVWRQFYDFGELTAQWPDQADGRQITEHKPGLPLLLIPGYLSFQMTGVRLSLALIAAFGSGVFFLMALARTESRHLALWIWALFSFTAPAWSQSQMVLTELPGAVLFLCILAAWEGVLPKATAALAAAGLIWLNVRFFPAAGFMLLMDLYFRRKDGARAILFSLLCFGLSLAGAFAYNLLEFGSFSPAHTYAQAQLPWSSLIVPAHLLRYSSGLMIDQEYGWLPYVPVYALAFFGLWALAVRKDPFLWKLLLPALVYLGPVACFPWWASAMAPNRYVVPLSAFFALACLEAWRAWGFRPFFVFLSLLSWFWACCLNILPWLCWGKLNGHNILLNLVGKALHIDLCAFFPSFWIEKPNSYFWDLGLLLFALYAAWRLGSPRAEPVRGSNLGG